MRAAAIAVVLMVLVAFACVPRTRGAELCLACGAEREARGFGPIVFHEDTARSKGTAWYERVVGACAQHTWHQVGCWETVSLLGTRVSCTELPEHHAFDEALAELGDDAAAREASRRYSALPPNTKLKVIEAFAFAELGRTIDERRAVLERSLSTLGCPELAAAVSSVGVEPRSR